MLKAYRILGFGGSLFFFLIGLLVLGSIAHDSNMYPLNAMMCLVFCALAYLFYNKTSTTLQVYKYITDLKLSKRFLKCELVFALVIFMLGLIMFSGSLSRVFSEQLPVFG